MKKMKIGFIALICSLIFLGCDPIKYTISGKVSSVSGEAINNANVSVFCKDRFFEQKSTLTDKDGFYYLKGSGFPEGCTMEFIHGNFTNKYIIIGNENIINGKYPGTPKYEINVELGGNK